MRARPEFTNPTTNQRGASSIRGHHPKNDLILARNQAKLCESTHEMGEIAEHKDEKGEVMRAINGMGIQPYKRKY